MRDNKTIQLSEELLKEIQKKDFKLNRVVALIREGADPNYSEGKLLLFSIKHRSLELVETLIKNGADVNEKSLILSEACEKSDYHIVKYLIDKGINVNGIQNDSFPLVKACEKGNVDIVKLLVEHNAFIANNAIIASIISKRNDILDFFIKKGIPYDATIISEAIFVKNWDAVKSLIFEANYPINTEQLFSNENAEKFFKSYDFQKELINKNPNKVVEIRNIINPQILIDFKEFFTSGEWGLIL